MKRNARPPDTANGLISRGTSAKAGSLMRPSSESARKTSEFGLVKNVPFTKGLNTGMMNSHFSSQTDNQKEMLEKFKKDSSGIASKLSQLSKKVTTKKKQIKVVAQNSEWSNEWKKLRKIQRELESEISDDYKGDREEYYYEIKHLIEEGRKNPLKSVRETFHRLIQDKVELTANEIFQLESEISTLYKNYESLNPLTIDGQIDNNTFSVDAFIESILDEYGIVLEDGGPLGLLIEEYKKRINFIIETYKRGKFQRTVHQWSNEDHEKFKHVYKQYQNGQHLNRNLVSYWELLKNMLPSKTDQDIKEHDTWYKQVHKIEIHKLKENREKLVKEMGKIGHIISETIIFYLGVIEAKKKDEEEKRRFGAIAEEARKMLEEQLVIKEERTKINNEKKAKEEEIQRLEEESQLTKERERREKLKQRLEQYMNEKDEMTRAKEESRKREQEKLQEEQVTMNKLNKERVHFRKNKEVEKNEKRKDEIRKKQEEAERRESQLNKLIDSVYEEMNLLEIEKDTNRLNQPTQSILYRQKEEQEQAETLKLYGYTSDQLMKDRKFKLQLMLQEAGLLNTDYAREIFSTLKPSKLTRVDNLTTDQKNFMK